MSKLSELLNERNAEGWSAREISRQAVRNGLNLSPATTAVLMNGSHGERPKDETLEALASVLPVSVEELRTAVGVSPDPGTPWMPPDDARYLDQHQRAALTQLIKTMIPAAAKQPQTSEENSDDGEAQEATVTPIRPQIDPRTNPYVSPIAARPRPSRSQPDVDGQGQNDPNR